MGIQPALICKLPGVERGCRLILFGSKYQFDVVVRALRLSRALIDVRAQPLDGPLHDVVALFSGVDSDVDWSRALRHMCELESIGFFDQHWAAEQGEGGMKRRHKKRRKSGFTQNTAARRTVLEVISGS